MKVDKGAVRLQIDNSIDGLRAYLSAVNIRNKCKVARETAERQPRGSREAAERQPRDNNLPNHADDLTPRLSSLLPLYPARPCRPRSTPSSSSSGSTRASACSTTPLAPPTRQDLASITGRGGWASPELLSGPFSSRRLASPTTPPSTR